MLNKTSVHGTASSTHVPSQDSWLKKNVLTFDGGGVRGFYSLLFMQRLMQFIASEEKDRGLISLVSREPLGTREKRVTSFSPCCEPRNLSHRDGNEDGYTPFLPCHYFDYIGGTSTGGLIAIMLGRFRMTVEDCIDEYTHLAGDVFGHPRHLHDMNTYGLIKRCKYDTKRFEAVIKDVIVRRVESGRNDLSNALFDTELGLCRVLVIANRIASEGVVTDLRLFRSYEINNHQKPERRPTQLLFPKDPRDEHGGRSGDLSVWQVARATTAAPLYFEPMEILTDGNPRQVRTNSWPKKYDSSPKPYRERLEDGGLGHANNPSKVMYDELTDNLPNNMSIGTFVSIGTARPMEQPTGPRLFRIIKGSISRLGNPEHIHNQMKNIVSKNQSFSYYRLNQPNGLSGIEMDDWDPKPSGKDTMKMMKSTFDAYIGSTEMVRYMQRCAKELVTARRARAEANLPKWERFAVGRHFYCRIPNCPDDEVRREIDEVKFIAHLKDGHNMRDDDIQAALRECEGQWAYRGR
ncbi:FabD/lysophospholipase-like protein [Annulohypoxylon maeteangense]|uniref:FabD/lysophospholipase-like protein n=1 Tax=Annulohypoxylon maeteangense TaxID=1927788 RepID=UPI002007CF71|nr:FabD/lysophospholipase-like protein [Annulohypoxylon maeteangense]KAI0884481.1 FabD/lysophospholipase-like protein [Annulohypoxylon maeteangense]